MTPATYPLSRFKGNARCRAIPLPRLKERAKILTGVDHFPSPLKNVVITDYKIKIGCTQGFSRGVL